MWICKHWNTKVQASSAKNIFLFLLRTKLYLKIIFKTDGIISEIRAVKNYISVYSINKKKIFIIPYFKNL